MPVPTDFKRRMLVYEYVDASKLLRIFRPKPGTHPTAIYYRRGGNNRFDAPPHARGRYCYKITYAAFDLSTCFAETITREDNQLPQLDARLKNAIDITNHLHVLVF